MNHRLLHLTLTALSTPMLCLALATSADASTKTASVTEMTASTAAGSYQLARPQAHISSKTRTARRSQESGCGDVNALAGDVSRSAHAHSVLCLLNRERTSRGLRPLSVSGRLSNAAARHNRDMVANGYFSHSSRGGGSSVGRIRSTGYMSGARSWMVGENLAWGSGTRSTPAAIVSAWMHSPGHRENILTGRFRDIGVGIDFSAPARVDGPAVTYTTEFGARG